MLFPTSGFLLFFIVVAAAMMLMETRFAAKKAVLVIASYYFYAQWNWRFCFLLASSSALSYGAGRLIGASADQDGEAPGACTRRAQDARARDELPLFVHERRERSAECEHDGADGDGGKRADTAGEGSEERLRGAPDELSDREREADRNDPEAGRGIDRRHEQSDCLARGHRDHQDGAAGGQEKPGARMVRRGRGALFVGHVRARSVRPPILAHRAPLVTA